MRTENIFFVSVVVGAIGAGLLLSPAPRVFGLWVIAFAAEAIRAGLVLINVEVRKVNPNQYWVVLLAAIVATFGIGAAIDNIAERYTMEWWAGQTINFLILSGEYSWAIVRAGVPVDWEMRCLEAEGQLRRVVEQRDSLNQKVANQSETIEEISADLDVSSKDLEAARIKIERYSNTIDAQTPVVESVKKIQNEKISINRVGSIVCHKCSVLVAPASNSHKPTHCHNCKTELKWKDK